MSNSNKKYPPPFSLRLTFEERKQLEDLAGDMTLGPYVRSQLFGANTKKRKTRGKRPVKDYQLLAQLLGHLGASRLSSNLNQLAKASNTGTLQVDTDTQHSLNKACEEIQSMRQTLMSALGLQTEE